MTYIQDRLNKDVINLYIDIMATGKQAYQQKDVESFLESKGISGIKVEEKSSSSTSTIKVYNIHLKTKEQALKLLTIEGEVRLNLSSLHLHSNLLTLKSH